MTNEMQKRFATIALRTLGPAEYDDDGKSFTDAEQQYLAEFIAIWKRRESGEITQEHCEHLMAAHECEFESIHGLGAGPRLRDRCIPKPESSAPLALPPEPSMAEFLQWVDEVTR